MHEADISVIIYNEKKRILFLISNLETGGVSKSMVSLLNTIDRQKYEVSLWIASPHGVLFFTDTKGSEDFF